MAIKAYEMGAKYVNIRVADMLLDKERAFYQENEDLSFVPEFLREYVNYRHPKGCQLPGFVENCFQHY